MCDEYDLLMLTEDESERLDQFLLNQNNGKGFFCLSQLDGFLTAIISGPNTVLSSEWLPVVWGGRSPSINQTEQEYEEIISLMFKLMNTNAAVLMHEPDSFEPLFSKREVDGKIHVIVDEWCDGYLRGVLMQYEQWSKMADLEEFIAPMKLFATQQGWEILNSMTMKDIEAWQQKIPDIVRFIYAYWVKKRMDDTGEFMNERHDANELFNDFELPYIQEAPKTRPDDPCPCNSGKKYKKCCGAH